MEKSNNVLPIWIITLLLVGVRPLEARLSVAEWGGVANYPTQFPSSFLSVDVPEIARQVTVRILTNPGAGSGVIIARQEHRYTVLTNHHVVADSSDNAYRVLTADGKMHSAQWRQSAEFKDIDLALVEFTSTESYTVAQMGNSNALAVGEAVYASGFPNWYLSNLQEIENTRDWGVKAFKLLTGQIEMLLPLSLAGGYQLGYTNNIEAGMSGGPVLNQYGQLIGINGRLKHPLQGIRVFKLIDGTLPSAEQFQQMEALSWAIPITAVQGKLIISH